MLELQKNEPEIYSLNGVHPSPTVAEEIVQFFKENYPEVHPEDLKRRDLSRYRNASDILEQIQSGNTWIVLRRLQQIAGIIKYRQEERLELQLTKQFLISWIMIAEKWRGRGVAPEILEICERHIATVDAVRTHARRILIGGDVHSDNIRQRLFLEHHDYSQLNGFTNNTFYYWKIVELEENA